MNKVIELTTIFYRLATESDPIKREENESVIPEEIKDVISRFSYNAFSEFERNHKAIQEIPYDTHSDLKDHYFQITIDGFWIFYAEMQLYSATLQEIEKLDAEAILDNWKTEIYPNPDMKLEAMHVNIRNLIRSNQELTLEGLIKRHKILNTMPVSIIRKISADFILLPMWIYYISSNHFCNIPTKTN